MKKWVKILIAVGVIAVVSVVLGIVLKAVGITSVWKLEEIINNAGVYGMLVFVLLYAVVNSLLCFVPATSMAFITAAMLIYGSNTKCFLLCYVAIVLTSLMMDAIGRFGGSKLVKKILGKEDYDSTMQLIRTKGVVYTPVMYLLPVFPDDCICMLNGVLKTNWIIHFLEIALCRGIGCATIIYGVNLLPQDLIQGLKRFRKNFFLEHIWEYVVMFTVIVFWVFMLFYIARKIDIALTKRLKKKNAKRTN